MRTTKCFNALSPILAEAWEESGMEKSELDKQIDEMMDAWYREHPDDDRDWIEIVQTQEFTDWTNQGRSE